MGAVLNRRHLALASAVALGLSGGAVAVTAQSDSPTPMLPGEYVCTFSPGRFDCVEKEVTPSTSTTVPPATTELPATTSEAPATTSSTTPATTSPESSTPSTQPDPWEARSGCLTGGDWSTPMRRLNASPELYGGGLLIWQRAWDLYGGTEFASSPAEASRSEQIALAERIVADAGPSPDWENC